MTHLIVSVCNNLIFFEKKIHAVGEKSFVYPFFFIFFNNLGWSHGLQPEFKKKKEKTILKIVIIIISMLIYYSCNNERLSLKT